MAKVILRSNGVTMIIENGVITKEHFTTTSDRGYYKNLGYRVEIEQINIRNKRKIA